MSKEHTSSERTTVSLPAELAQRLRYEAKRSHRPTSNIVRDALEKYLPAGDEPLPLPSFVGTGAWEGPPYAENSREFYEQGLNEDWARQMREYDEYRAAKKKPGK